MTNLKTILQQLNIPYAYHHFAESQSPKPPFAVYLLPNTNHFKADGKIHFKVSVVHLEIYTDKKDLLLERQVEQVLDRNDIIYEKSEVWIESEKLYEVLYLFEMEEEKLWEIKSNTI
ncbi:TPA: hypothetical protein U1160_002115 [Streptococcus suis]|nr:hypothetical protein [Streptococcus suis]HEM4926399.1 hypothetical protein [Streptococcus suis]